MEQVSTTTSSRESGADATTLALSRTRLAYERTLMAWVRTGLALISFGFTIYKFFALQLGNVQEGLISARTFGLLMISIGLFAVGAATLQHRQDIRHLASLGAAPGRSLAVTVAALVSALGILGLVAVIFRQ